MLRPYQTEALEAVKNRQVSRGIIALPTGTGKSHVAGNLAESLGTQKILYLAHREELIDQLAGHVERVIGYGKVGIEQASRRISYFAPSCIASIPTLVARKCRRLKAFRDGRFEALVVDEAHHSTAESYIKIWQHFGLLDEHKKKVENPSMPLIGLTATPSRGDNVGLSNVFDDIIYQMSLAKAIEDGWLVPIHAYTVKTKTSLDGIKTRMGDYAEKELAERVSTDLRNETIFNACQENANGLKTLIFCVNIEHAQKVAEYFNERDVKAKYTAGNLPNDLRKYTLHWFKTTPGAVLTNCQLITEGVDIPSVECVVMARPTKSKTFYCQCIGRGTRLAHGANNYDESVRLGKDRVILLDITDTTSDIGRRAVNVSDIFGAPLPTKELNGCEMLNELKEQQLLMEKARRGEYIGTEAIEINLFAMPADLSGAKMAWLDYGDMFRLSLANRGDITILSDTLDRWRAIFYDGTINEERIIYKEIASQQEIVKSVETWVQHHYAEIMILVKKAARWRGDKPTQAQRNLCKRLGVIIPKDATKGDVSMAIDRRLTSLKGKKRKKITLL
jgi:ATP-dependent helicase IRC3